MALRRLRIREAIHKADAGRSRAAVSPLQRRQVRGRAVSRTEPPRRVFSWREPLLDALRRDPNMSRACNAAHISRNSAYTHMRRDPVFRRQVDGALDQAREASYRVHREQLRSDPGFQRAMQRAEAALRFWTARADITDCITDTAPTRARLTSGASKVPPYTLRLIAPRTTTEN